MMLLVVAFDDGVVVFLFNQGGTDRTCCREKIFESRMREDSCLTRSSSSPPSRVIRRESKEREV
eukprot:scaffold10570_cov176-Amphora_coffeaeformis.AAC.10